MLREASLHTVCEEASCPNIGECFGKGTATFMVLGDLCTRRCPFCDVAHGRPQPPDPLEPEHLAETVARLGLNYVVVTSVDRDDLRDGGAAHFADCIRAVRRRSPATRIEILTPDFRGRAEIALDILAADPPDVMNHNLETVPRLYRQARPGADYAHSLRLLASFRERCPEVPTKSGLMLGLGETDDEVLDVMRDLRDHRRRHADRRTVPADPAPATWRCSAMSSRRSSTPWRCRPVPWVSLTRPAGRWFARATTPTGKRTPPASEPRQRISKETFVDHQPVAKPFYKSLYFQVVTAIVIGVLLGHFYPHTGEAMKPLGDGFIKLIKMIIAPIIFCTVVVGIAGMEDMKKVGKTGGLALLYFEIVSSIALVVGLVIINLVQPGPGDEHRSPARWTPRASRPTPVPARWRPPPSSCST